MSYIQHTWATGEVIQAANLNNIEAAVAAHDLKVSALATVATSGAYGDLTGKPALAPVATSGNYNDLTSKPVLANVATSGSYVDLTNKPALATVATSGSYNDLSSKPTLYTDNAAINAVGNSLIAGDQVVIAYDSLAHTITINANTNGLTSVGYADLPAGSVLRVTKDPSTGWPVRPTTRTDVLVIWQGADPAPAIGGSGMLDWDEHHVTP